MHEPPEWTATASNRAVISRDELCAWLGCERRELAGMIRDRGFPQPLYTSADNRSGHVTSTCRWRVGDVRRWLHEAPSAAHKPTPSKPSAISAYFRAHTIMPDRQIDSSHPAWPFAHHHKSDTLEAS